MCMKLCVKEEDGAFIKILILCASKNILLKLKKKAPTVSLRGLSWKVSTGDQLLFSQTSISTC